MTNDSISLLSYANWPNLKNLNLSTKHFIEDKNKNIDLGILNLTKVNVRVILPTKIIQAMPKVINTLQTYD